MTDLTFRHAIEADIPTLLALSAAGAVGASEDDPAEAGDPRYAAAFEAMAADPNHELVVAELDGEVVATVQISRIPGLTRHGQWRGLLENVHVRADLRGQGVGSKLIEWAIARCRDTGCGMVQLTSNKARHDAHRFYRRLGFEASHEGFKLKL